MRRVRQVGQVGRVGQVRQVGWVGQVRQVGVRAAPAIVGRVRQVGELFGYRSVILRLSFAHCSLFLYRWYRGGS